MSIGYRVLSHQRRSPILYGFSGAAMSFVEILSRSGTARCTSTSQSTGAGDSCCAGPDQITLNQQLVGEKARAVRKVTRALQTMPNFNLTVSRSILPIEYLCRL